LIFTKLFCDGIIYALLTRIVFHSVLQDVLSDPNVSFSMTRPDSSDFGSVMIPHETDTVDGKEEVQRRGVIITVGSYIRRQSYIGTLIIMMVSKCLLHGLVIRYGL